MARTDITKTQSALNAGAAVTEINLATVAADGGKVLLSKDESIVVYAENTAATTSKLTIKAGAFSGAGIGDLEIDLVQNVPQIVGPLEGMRFAQADGYAYLDCAITATGVIAALDLNF
jgi:hypothetical protein